MYSAGQKILHSDDQVGSLRKLNIKSYILCTTTILHHCLFRRPLTGPLAKTNLALERSYYAVYIIQICSWISLCYYVDLAEMCRLSQCLPTHFHCIITTGESGLIYTAHLVTTAGKELVVVKSGNGIHIYLIYGATKVYVCFCFCCSSSFWT